MNYGQGNYPQGSMVGATNPQMYNRPIPGNYNMSNQMQMYNRSMNPAMMMRSGMNAYNSGYGMVRLTENLHSLKL